MARPIATTLSPEPVKRSGVTLDLHFSSLLLLKKNDPEQMPDKEIVFLFALFALCLGVEVVVYLFHVILLIYLSFRSAHAGDLRRGF